MEETPQRMWWWEERSAVEMTRQTLIPNAAYAYLEAERRLYGLDADQSVPCSSQCSVPFD
jgi:hypothetical protein